MERAPAMYLLIALLAFYLSVPSSARVLQRMPMQEVGQMLPAQGSIPEAKMEITEVFVPEDDESVITERMAFETQDYGPPGPNNHHKPPSG
ncbi:hypothetical protein U9M48_014379 [Paspalum notatum var. saurae]|uniref:Uncharacterized protein n=1 Tax=Paspalum notatum var. saurae TaxID=547442 RepID=A0AAQ3T1Y3_PASNO